MMTKILLVRSSAGDDEEVLIIIVVRTRDNGVTGAIVVEKREQCQPWILSKSSIIILRLGARQEEVVLVL